MFNRILFRFYHAIFLWLAKLYPTIPKNLQQCEFKSILVFSAAGIGDTLTDSVAIRALKESFSRARITVVTHRRRQLLARHNPFADEIIPYHKSLLHFPFLTLELRKRKPDVVVMLRGNDPDLWPMAWLVNRHAIVSCPIMTRFRFLISHPVEVPLWDQTHGVEQTLEIVRTLGADTPDRRLIYQVQDQERTAIRKKLSQFPDPLKPRVIFQLGGGQRSAWRDWPVDYWEILGRNLLLNYDVQLVLLGGKDLRSKADSLRPRLSGSILDLVGQLSLAESAALLAESTILVSTDTGIMHLGFAVGIDTLALIHCNNPASRVGPYHYGKQHLVAQLEPLPGMAVSKEVSMRGLTPENVWPKLESLCLRHTLSRRPIS